MTAIDPPPAGSARQLLCQFEPDARDALQALFALEREIEDSARPGIDHGVGHARLDWWGAECARLAAGAPRHPASLALQAALRRMGRDAVDLSALVDAARWRFARATFESRDELMQGLNGWARTLFGMLPSLTNQAEPGLDQRLAAFCLRAGAAVREIELLMAARPLALRGLVFLPLDELARAGIDHTALHAAPWPASLADRLRSRYAHAEGELRAAAAALATDDRRAARVPLVWADLACDAARDATAALPIEYAAGRLEPLAATWRAWRAARAALQGRLPPRLR